MDKVRVKGLRVFAYHGVNEAEKINGQNFELNINAYIDVKNSAMSDKLDDTINYAKICKLAVDAMKKEKYNLIETAAEKVATQILNECEAVKKVKVLLKKPEAPMNVAFDYTAVNISRKKSDLH